MSDLVTGATGFIGTHLTRALLATGRQVRILARSTSDPGGLKALGAEVVTGDISYPVCLPRALEGVTRVFHCAAHVSDWGSWEDFRRANVEGVENMLAAASQARVQRFIHLSTTDVYGFPGQPGDETLPFVERGWPYGDTKIEGERKVWEYHRYHGLPVTVLRPANVYGVGSRSFVLEIAGLLKKRNLINLGRGRTSAGLCNVNNLVTCILLAASKKQGVGQAYNVTDGSEMSWREFVSALAAKAELPEPRITLPRGVAYAAGWLMENLGSLWRRGRRPLLTRMAVEIFSANQAYSIDKARRELGYGPRDSALDEMDAMVSWLRTEVG